MILFAKICRSVWINQTRNQEWRISLRHMSHFLDVTVYSWSTKSMKTLQSDTFCRQSDLSRLKLDMSQIYDLKNCTWNKTLKVLWTLQLIFETHPSYWRKLQGIDQCRLKKLNTWIRPAYDKVRNGYQYVYTVLIRKRVERIGWITVLTWLRKKRKGYWRHISNSMRRLVFQIQL